MSTSLVGFHDVICPEWSGEGTTSAHNNIQLTTCGCYTAAFAPTLLTRPNLLTLIKVRAV